jgi:hypothetical protein
MRKRSHQGRENTIGAEPRLGTTQFFLGICELNEEDEGISYNSRFVFALGFAFGYGARAAVYLFRARRRLSFKIYAISVLKPGVVQGVGSADSACTLASTS